MNPLMLGGLMAGGIGAGAAAWRIVKRLWGMVHRFFVTTVDVADHDHAFFWLQKWLAEHPYASRARLLTASTRTTPGDAPTASSVRTRPEIIFSPAPGVHIVRYQGHRIVITRVRKDVQVMASTMYREAFELRMFSRDRSVLRSLLQEARDLALPPEQPMVDIYGQRWGEWSRSARRPLRDAASVVLTPGVVEGVIADAQQFLASAAWYRGVGVPHRRGYLFHGPPGNGKTSLVVALASALHWDVAALDVAESGFGDGHLRNAFMGVPPRTLLLLEDIDAAFHGREHQGKSDVTFSGLLNVIDGIGSAEGRILVVTTNHVEHLDPALIRPGRIDRKVLVGNASQEQCRRLYLRFNPGDEGAAERFAASLPEGSCMADAQNRLLQLRSEAEQVRRG